MAWRLPNAGIELSMEFGPGWLRPTQARLAQRFPRLRPDELEAVDRVCRGAMDLGHRQARSQWRKANGSQTEAYRRFAAAMLSRDPWISEPDLRHLSSQGCYHDYTWKDGEMCFFASHRSSTCSELWPSELFNS